MSSTAVLSEPQVLAHAKRRLFPDPEEANTYAVTDTQFAMAEWLPGEPISEAVRERLAPFNHVRLGSGYPDLVGVRALESDLLPSGGVNRIVSLRSRIPGGSGLPSHGTVNGFRAVRGLFETARRRGPRGHRGRQ